MVEVTDRALSVCEDLGPIPDTIFFPEHFHVWDSHYSLLTHNEKATYSK